MKTNAIVRIVLYSLAIILLLGILGVALGVHLFMFRSSGERNSEVTHTPERIESDRDADSSQNSLFADNDVVTAKPDEIREIEIDWVCGNITIATSAETDVITVSEPNSQKESERMVCTQKGGTLSIQYSKEAIRFPSFGVNISAEKDLVILVPEGWECRSVEIQSASADILIQNMVIAELDFEGASGNCKIENSDIGSFDVDAASGNIDFCGSLNTLDFDGASSDCTLVLTNCPKSLELDGMSGELDLTLPEDCGFTAELNGLGTNFSSEFETTTRNHSHIHGDGACRISVESMSGSISIHKGTGSCHDHHH